MASRLAHAPANAVVEGREHLAPSSVDNGGDPRF
jgi:hypothetical protein